MLGSSVKIQAPGSSAREDTDHFPRQGNYN